MATEFKLSFTAAEVNSRLGKIDELAEKSELPTKISDLINDTGFVTDYAETDPTVPAWAKEATKPTYTADEVGALPADTVIPTVPTDVSAFTNDAGYLTEHQSLEGLATQDYVDGALAQKQPMGDYALKSDISPSIIDVVELPTENINEGVFYRLLTGKFVANQESVSDTWTVHCVESLPETGEVVTNTAMNYLIGYYSLADGNVYGYVDSDLGTALGASAGWYPLSALGEMSGTPFSGVITDISDDPKDGALRLLLNYDFYIHKNGWVKTVFAYEKAPKFDITWDGDMTGRTALDMSLLGYDSGVYFVKVSDDALTTDEVMGSTITISFFNGDSPNSIVVDDIGYIDTTTYAGAFSIRDCVVVVHDGDALAAALGIPTGIYTNGVYFLLNVSLYVSRFTAPAKITKIDKKYLDMPELATVATTGDYYSLSNRPTVYTDVVRYTAQSLNSTQKTRARTNIDVYSKSEVDTKIANVNIDVDLSDYAKTTDLGSYLPLSGGTMTGSLVLSGSPVEDLEAATKQYVDSIGNNSICGEYKKITLPVSAYWNSVCYGDGKFVAVSRNNSNIAAYSEDGINWVQTTMPVSVTWTSVTYGDGKFVAVSSQVVVNNIYSSTNIAAYSEDGINWVQTTMPVSANWNSVTYGDGKFVAVSSSAEGTNIAAYSEDGINWVQTTMPVSVTWTSVTYGDGKFVAVAYFAEGTNIAAYSTDGINWVQTTMPVSVTWTSVTYGDGKFVAGGISNIAAYSEDGINWIQTTMPVSASWNSVCYGNDKFVAIDGSYNGTNIAAYSEDGINWVQTTMPVSVTWTSVTYGDGKFVAVSRNNSNIAAYSEDGINWTDESYTITSLTQSNTDITADVATVIQPYLNLTAADLTADQLTELSTLLEGV